MDEHLLKLVLAELRRENVDLLRKKRKDLDENRDDLVKRREHLNQCITLLDKRGELESGILRWVQRWDSVDALLPELVSLANIRPTEYRGFCVAVHERLLRYINLDRSADRDEKMLEAEKRLRSAQDAINALSKDQQLALTQAILGSIPFDDYDDLPQQISKILVGIARMTGSGPYRPNEPNKRGPRTERSHLMLRELVTDLWLMAQEHGGDFTISVDDEGRARGTMVQALRLLEPILPPGIVPRVLPATTIKRLRPDRNFRK
jgi:hypothetical protein